ncbi:hypothetical protein [Geosporobacter ferrireducens]|uniref:hypothetical protein n=1 Tax=Geosporobacter ferrireducens TaxID=1424294 RepID=UPI0012E9AF8F|nr:hypothetical protein [Geosporobacter ferrireducens]
MAAVLPKEKFLFFENMVFILSYQQVLRPENLDLGGEVERYRDRISCCIIEVAIIEQG